MEGCHADIAVDSLDALLGPITEQLCDFVEDLHTRLQKGGAPPDWIELSFGCVRDQWSAVLGRDTPSSGTVEFEDTTYPGPRRLEMSFELWKVDARFSELSHSGCGFGGQHNWR